MQDDGFEWDDEKAADNWRDHDVAFSAARAAFQDAFAEELEDRRLDYGEPRYVLLGMVDQRLLYVAYTIRDGRIRIISARRADPKERRRYHEANRDP